MQSIDSIEKTRGNVLVSFCFVIFSFVSFHEKNCFHKKWLLSVFLPFNRPSWSRWILGGSLRSCRFVWLKHINNVYIFMFSIKKSSHWKMSVKIIFVNFCTSVEYSAVFSFISMVVFVMLIEQIIILNCFYILSILWKGVVVAFLIL